MKCTTCGTKIVIAEAKFVQGANAAELSFTVVHYCEKCGLVYQPASCSHRDICNWPEIEIKKMTA